MTEMQVSGARTDHHQRKVGTLLGDDFVPLRAGNITIDAVKSAGNDLESREESPPTDLVRQADSDGKRYNVRTSF